MLSKLRTIPWMQPILPKIRTILWIQLKKKKIILHKMPRDKGFLSLKKLLAGLPLKFDCSNLIRFALLIQRIILNLFQTDWFLTKSFPHLCVINMSHMWYLGRYLTVGILICTQGIHACQKNLKFHFLIKVPNWVWTLSVPNWL